MRRPALDKVVFVLSLCGLVWFYGYATHAAEWWPTDLLVAAQEQARQVLSGVGVLSNTQPAYVHEQVYQGNGPRRVNPDKIQPGYTLITSSWRHGGEWRPGLRLIDQEGMVLHEWSIDPGQVFDQPGVNLGLSDLDIQGSYLFDNGDVLVNLEYGGTLRVDACGKVQWQLTEGNHHSIARSDDGTFWIPAVTSEKRLTSPDYPDGLPGAQNPAYQDQILQVSEDGTVLRRINVLDLIYANDLQRHIAEELRTHEEDPAHLNDIEPLSDTLANEYPTFEAGDLLVSLRELELILVFDPKSMKVKWHASRPFILQHDPDFIGNGWIGLFDNNVDGTNRGSFLGGSRVIALQPRTDSVKVLFSKTDSGSIYTRYRGKWQMLPNGNLLLTEARPGRVIEVDRKGSVVWEWIHPGHNGKIAEVTKAERLNLTRNTIGDWPCSAGDSTNYREKTSS